MGIIKAESGKKRHNEGSYEEKEDVRKVLEKT
jgi:hypothetical protein